MPRNHKTSFTGLINFTGDSDVLDRDGEEIEVEFDVSVSVSPGAPATRWQPEEYPEVEILSIGFGKHKMNLSQELWDELQKQADEEAGDGNLEEDYDPPEPDYPEYDERRDDGPDYD